MITAFLHVVVDVVIILLAFLPHGVLLRYL